MGPEGESYQPDRQGSRADTVTARNVEIDATSEGLRQRSASSKDAADGYIGQ